MTPSSDAKNMRWSHRLFEINCYSSAPLVFSLLSSPPYLFETYTRNIMHLFFWILCWKSPLIFCIIVQNKGDADMRYDFTQLDRQLRLPGRIIQLFLGTFVPWKVIVANFFLKVFHLFRPVGIQKDVNWIPSSDGSRLRLCIYRLKGSPQDVPGILWMHGGGYLIGTPEQDHKYIKRLMQRKPCVVVAPDYRLAGTAPYPAALEDCYAALQWMKHHAPQLGIRTDQLFIGGNSAGGGLTAALSLYARDLGEVAIAFQMPLYPMIDDRMANPSARCNNAPVWNSKSNELGWKSYLGNLYGTPDVPAYAAAARATDFTGLPPTCTFVGTAEPFFDETVQYVKALQRAGVKVFFRQFEGCYHAFDRMAPGSQKAKQAIHFLLECYEYAVENFFAWQT